jgi:hypothetical protein
MIEFDSSEFEKDIIDLHNTGIDKISQDADGKAAIQLLDDVLNVFPKPPVDEANLRGSGVIKEENGTTIIALDTPYAAYQNDMYNEGQSRSTYQSHKRDKIDPRANEGTGPGFMTKKIGPFVSEYPEILADEIDKKL